MKKEFSKKYVDVQKIAYIDVDTLERLGLTAFDIEAIQMMTSVGWMIIVSGDEYTIPEKVVEIQRRLLPENSESNKILWKLRDENGSTVENIINIALQEKPVGILSDKIHTLDDFDYLEDSLNVYFYHTYLAKNYIKEGDGYVSSLAEFLYDLHEKFIRFYN